MFFSQGNFFLIFQYFIQHCFICCPSDFTVLVNAGIEHLFLVKILKFFVNSVLWICFLVRKIQIQDLGSGMEKSRSRIKPWILNTGKQHQIMSLWLFPVLQIRDVFPISRISIPGLDKKGIRSRCQTSTRSEIQDLWHWFFRKILSEIWRNGSNSVTCTENNTDQT